MYRKNFFILGFKRCFIFQIYRGKIYAGATQLASRIVVEQTGLMQITIRAGSFTTTGDKKLKIRPETFNLKSDQVFNLLSDEEYNKFYTKLTDQIDIFAVSTSFSMEEIKQTTSLPLNYL